MNKFSIIFISVFFIFCFSCSKFDPETDGKLLREACDLPHPPKTKKLEEKEIFRPHAGVVTKFYTHESGCTVVEDYYQTVLKERGWEKVPYSYFRNHGFIEFKKGDVTITLECSETIDRWKTKRFSIDCSKGL